LDELKYPAAGIDSGTRRSFEVVLNPLHRARIERGISLEEVASRTCLSPRIVQLLDSGHFALLPGGLYARSYVRTFAAVVGLNAETVIAQLGERLPAEQDPIPVWRENMRATLPPLVQDATELAERIEAAILGGLSGHTLSRLRLLRPGCALPIRDYPWHRVAATAFDASVVVVLFAAIIRLTAWTAGIGVRDALDLAGLPAAAVCTLVLVPYFAAFGSLGGRPLCRMLGGAPAPRPIAAEPGGLPWETHPDRVGAGC
jgi:hypothetical protein